MDMKVLTGKRAEELAAEYPASAFFSDTSIGMDYAEWRKGEMLASAFDMPGFLIFVFSGKVKVSAYREDGSEFVLPSENDIVIGDIQLMTGKPSPFYAEAASDVVGGIVSIDRFGEALKNDVLFLRGTLSLMAEHMDRMLLPGISSDPSSERLFAYIVNICNGRLENVSQAASALHLSRRHVHRLLQSLLDEGRLIHEGHGVYRRWHNPSDD